VPRQACLDSDLCGLEITNLTDHHDVGVLSKNCAQATSKCHIDLCVDLRLPDPVDEVLDWVLDGHDISAVVVNSFQSRIQRRCLTGTGRSGNENNAVRFVDQVINLLSRLRVHAERHQVESTSLFVEQAKYDAFAVTGRHRRHANIYRTTGNTQGNAAILRQSFLGYVQL